MEPSCSASAFRYRRILIFSRHALFGEGLRRLLAQPLYRELEVVGSAMSLEEASLLIQKAQPKIILADEEQIALKLLNMAGVWSSLPVRVVLLSLEMDDPAVIYDRRELAATEMPQWLPQLFS